MKTKNLVVMFFLTVIATSCGKNDTTVNVETDTAKPVIALTGANPQVITVGEAYAELGAIATDNVDGDITADIVIDTNAVDMAQAGDYTVTYNVSDAAGNAADQVARTVTVTAATIQITVTTLAGSTEGFWDGTGTAARFDAPFGVAVDADGNVYVADTGNHRIRKISPGGATTTLAGSTEGFADGAGADAQFDAPFGVAVDADGNVYVADTGNHRIRKISPEGVTSTLAGSTEGFADATGTAAQFDRPFGVAVDAKGYVYVADSDNNRIRKISPEGVTTTLAGSDDSDFADGAGAAARFDSPTGVAVDADGYVYVGDTFNERIRKISPEGVTTTLAGSGTRGFADGAGADAQFSYPYGVAVDAQGNVYVADRFNYRVRKISPDGETSTLAGSTEGSADGTGPDAQFAAPTGVAVDAQSNVNVYVADRGHNHRIRKISQD